MSTSKRIIVVVFLLAVLFALPSAALANKRVFKAKLTTGAELHEVVNSRAAGNFMMAPFPDGKFRFGLNVWNLTGAPTGMHLHGPATSSETAPVLVTLCGSPAPAAVATCPFDGTFSTLEGTLTSSLLAQWGLNQGDFQTWLTEGKIYVNVHTAQNPAGEVRGQLYEP